MKLHHIPPHNVPHMMVSMLQVSDMNSDLGFCLLLIEVEQVSDVKEKVF